MVTRWRCQTSGTTQPDKLRNSRTLVNPRRTLVNQPCALVNQPCTLVNPHHTSVSSHSGLVNTYRTHIPTVYSHQPTVYSHQPTMYSRQPTVYSHQPKAHSGQSAVNFHGILLILLMLLPSPYFRLTFASRRLTVVLLCSYSRLTPAKTTPYSRADHIT